MFVTTKTTDGYSSQDVEDAVAQAIQDSAPSELDIASVSVSFREDEAEKLEALEGDLTMLWTGEAFINISLPDSSDTTKEVVDNSLMDIDVQDEDGVCQDITLSLED